MEQVREFKIKDAPALWKLYRNEFPNPCPSPNFNESLFGGKCWVYETVGRFDESIIKGFVITVIEDGEPWLWCICTQKDSRNRGIGTSLLRRLEEDYRGRYRKINLFVDVENPAQKLYFDVGYKVKKVEKGLYPNGDGLWMVKNL